MPTAENTEALRTANHRGTEARRKTVVVGALAGIPIPGRATTTNSCFSVSRCLCGKPFSVSQRLRIPGIPSLDGGAGGERAGEDGIADSIVNLALERDDGIAGETPEDREGDTRRLLGHAVMTANGAAPFQSPIRRATAA